MTGLQSMLTSEVSSIGALLPAGIRSVLSAPAAAVEGVTSAAHTAARHAPGWLIPAILALLLAMGLMWLIGRRTSPERIASTARDTASGVAHRLGAFFDHKLPNNVTLRIPQNGVENRLIGFIQDSTSPVSREVWFDFDRLRFDTGAATVQAESQEQLRNISEILKAYPNVHVKIGGYTDNIGDAGANMRLSQARANTVKNELIALGIAPDRIEAEGYGDQHPAADNTTEQGRARNRRIAIRVTQK